MKRSNALFRTLIHGLLAVMVPITAPALAQTQTCGADPATSPNHSDNYILGRVEGETTNQIVPAAMHWNTGLVWKRCSQGFSGDDCSAGSAEESQWNDLMNDFMPKSFEGQNQWWAALPGYTPDPDTGPVGVDRLQDGTWRMAYVTELEAITAGCENNPKVNRHAFPNMPPVNHWSASPQQNAQYRVLFSLPYTFGERVGHGPMFPFTTKLVRGGQPFDLLNDPPPRHVASGSMVSFDLMLASQSGSGSAWGGARITGEGTPEFSLDGGVTWVTEAIVQSGNAIQVRMTAGTSSEIRHATLAVRSGETHGTADGSTPGNCPTCGHESTQMHETTATFAVTGLGPWPITTETDPSAVATVACTPNPVPHYQASECDFADASVAPGYHFSHWSINDSTQDNTRPLSLLVPTTANVTAHFLPNTYTVSFHANGGENPPASVTGAYTTSIVLPLTTPTYNAHTFSGWNTLADGSGSAYSAGGSFIVPAVDTTLYAQWALNQYTLTAQVDGANGSITPPTQDVAHGSVASFIITPDAGHHALVPLGGDCPVGTLSGTSYTTGTIVIDCHLIARFAQNDAATLTLVGSAALSTPVGQSFATPLRVRVADAEGVGLDGIQVSFTTTPDANGANASLASITGNAGHPALTLPTDANGIATVYASANAIAGSYEVSAHLAGIGRVDLLLSNEPLPAGLSLSAFPTNVSPGQTSVVTAALSGDNALPFSGRVTFYLNGTPACENVPVAADGTATCTVGPFAIGAHELTASYDGGSSHTPSATVAPLGLTALVPVQVPASSPWSLTALISLLALATLAARSQRQRHPIPPKS